MYVVLYSKIVMMLSQFMVTQCANKLWLLVVLILLVGGSGSSDFSVISFHDFREKCVFGRAS
jgi:hypothetical protein